MSRLRALVLLALGCALAVAAASTGPFLEKDRQVSPYEGFRRGDRDFSVRVVRPPGAGQGDRETPVAHDYVGMFFTMLLGLVIVGLVVFGLIRLVDRLRRLRALGSAPGVDERRTKAYDPGDESDDDAETVLRQRVAEELRLLSVDLDADVEPRDAVIACYVRMENALAEAGAPRAATETPLELMRRVMESFAAPPADVRRLTELFTQARFSPHPVTDDMRQAARRSLAVVADALAVRA